MSVRSDVAGSGSSISGRSQGLELLLAPRPELAAIARLLRWSAPRSPLRCLPRVIALRRSAEEHGVVPTPDELRAVREELSGDPVLAAADLDVVDREALIEAEALRLGLRRRLAAVDALQEMLAARRRWFETVELSAVAFDREPEAEALRAAALCGRTAFPVEAPPQTETLAHRPAVGYLGLVTRADLPPELAEPAFADGVGPYVGPIRYAGRFWVLQLLLPKRPEITAHVISLCADQLVEAALDRALRQSSPESASASSSGGT